MSIFRLIAIFLFSIFALSAFPQSAAESIVKELSDTYNVDFSNDNRLVIFRTGQEKFDDMLVAIDEATSSIHLEYFNFRNDSISDILFHKLALKAAAGVEVRAIFDGFGNMSNNRPLKKHKVDSLRQLGINIVEFDPVRFPYINHAIHRDHRKIVVIDGIIAYTGGMNVADYYITGKPEFGEWKDIHCRIEGSCVGELQKIFIRFWNKVTKDSVSGAHYYNEWCDARRKFHMLKQDTTATSGAKLIGVVDRGPKSPRRIIHDTFVASINSAHDSIQIINPYLTLCCHIRRALRHALERGVKVEIMVSKLSDIPITPRVVEHNTHRLMKKGADVYFFLGGFHHSKIMMIDGEATFVGSSNLNSRSLSFDYECNLLVADKATTAQFQRIFTEDKINRCFKLTPQTWKSEFSKKHRFGAWFFQFLTPFL